MGRRNIGRAPQKEIQLRGQTVSTCEYLRSSTSCGVTNACGSDALSSSMLECRLHVKHCIRKDVFIGVTKDAIEMLLDEGAAGRLYIYIFMLNPFANNLFFLAITRELCIYDAHGNRRQTGIIIEFTITTTSTAFDATGLNMEEAVTQGKEALVRMNLAPSSLEPIQDAVDTSVAVVANIKSLSTTWSPLLDKVKLLSELFDGIAQVSG